jgi:hypothetical protein
MKLSHGLVMFSSLSLLAFGAQAQEETIVVLPDEAAGTARSLTENIVWPDEAAGGREIAEANRADAGENAAEAAENALVALAEAQANAADAAQDGLQTAIDAVEGARGDLGRGNIPEDLPDGAPTDVPAVPDDVLPDNVDLPEPPVGD